jgi:hypothetical protein
MSTHAHTKQYSLYLLILNKLFTDVLKQRIACIRPRHFGHPVQKERFCGRADSISLEFCAVQLFTCFPFVSEVSFPLTGMVRCCAVGSVRDLTLRVSCEVLRIEETNMKRDDMHGTSTSRRISESEYRCCPL